MSRNSLSRREALKIGAGAVSLAALAGCVGPFSGDGESNSSFDAVPADAEFVATVDVERVLDDDLLRERIEGTTENDSAPGTPSSVDGLLDGVEDSFGLDPRAISELLVFGQGVEAAAAADATTTEPGTAAVAEAEWSESDVEVAVSEAGGDVESTTHAGQSVYETPEFAVGVLPDDRYAVGLPEMVRESLDVAGGDADALAGDLAEQFESAPDGYVRGAFEASLDLPEDAGGGPFDPSQFEAVEYVTAAMYRDDDSRGATVTFETDSEDAAESIANTLESGRSLAAMDAQEGDASEVFDGDLAAVTEATDVEPDGSTVTVENTDGRGLVPTILIAVVGAFVLPMGESSGPASPQVSFQFEYDDGDGTVTIMHSAGDSIPATELFVRGTGIEPMGSWEQIDGDASGDSGGEPAVTAGDIATIDASEDAEAIVVWESPDEGASATLASWEGPAV